MIKCCVNMSCRLIIVIMLSIVWTGCNAMNLLDCNKVFDRDFDISWEMNIKQLDT